MKLKVGDKVVVIAGSSKGKEGKITKTFKDENKVIVEGVNIVKKTVKLSYIDGNEYHFMDQETYDDIMLDEDYLGDNAGYISPDDDYEVSVTYYNDKPVGVVLPVNVTRTITYCEPGVKGDTSGKSTKPATLDTGMEVKVPLFCNTDDRIVIDTRDGSFVERAKD